MASEEKMGLSGTSGDCSLVLGKGPQLHLVQPAVGSDLA